MKIDGVEVTIGDKVLVIGIDRWWTRLWCWITRQKPKQNGVYTVTEEMEW